MSGNVVRFYNDDEVRKLPTKELADTLYKYKRMLSRDNSVKNLNVDRRRLEVEICYLQRELQSREKWSKSFAESGFQKNR